ncbi:hypothetical protein FRC12_013215 [Ceratobasidium sp. 428]|nr:hypothetical protein FRC12_013215 [Ceratobasidium sp. 428]
MVMHQHRWTRHRPQNYTSVPDYIPAQILRCVAATVGSTARPAVQAYARQLRSDPLAGPASAPATSVPTLVAPYPPAIVAAVAPVLNAVTVLALAGPSAQLVPQTQVLPNPALAPAEIAPTPVVVAAPSTNVAIPLAAPISIALRPPKPAADALNRPKAN